MDKSKITDENLGAGHIVTALVASFASFAGFHFSQLGGDNADIVYEMAAGSLFAMAVASIIPTLIAWIIKPKYKTITYIVSVLVFSGMSIAGQSGINLTGSPRNFEQCMIDKMKGQPANMGAIVTKECRRLFPQD